MLEQILKQLEKGIINWYGAQILIEDLYKNNGVLGSVSKCDCGAEYYHTYKCVNTNCENCIIHKD
tara:strand:- start:166 stop:360 length:195 start_codon:yes stop_codon:yes gene_type:complete